MVIFFSTASATAPEFLDRLTTREVKEGESVRFTIRVMGKPAPEVTWYREGSQIISSPDFEIIKDGETSSLYIPEVFYEDSGKFSVKAENPGGVNTCTAELIVEGERSYIYVDVLVQKRCDSSVLAVELCLSCINPLIYGHLTN